MGTIFQKNTITEPALFTPFYSGSVVKTQI